MFFAALYRKLSPLRPFLYTAVLLLLGLGLVGMFRMEMREDIEAMLPDDTSTVAADFRRLQKAPFARKVLISLRRDDAVETERLLEEADRLAAALSPNYFTGPITGPAAYANGGLALWMVETLPNLCSAEDLAGIALTLTPDGVRDRVDNDYRRLISPEGWVVKDLVRRDPLELRTHGFDKLRYLNPITQTRIQDGHFLSADGRSALIIAETPVPITDSKGGAALVADFDAATRNLPSGIRATLISGHPYTLANAAAIQDDLKVVLGGATLAIVALFFFFLRSWRALFVFLVPVSVLGVATVAVMLCYDTVSGVTIGFGAVLLGITVDFGLHVFFALRHGDGEPADILGDVSRPVLFGGLTTLCAFAVLLGSNLPGQRQLAVFSMVGIAAALVLSLVVLPHLVAPGKVMPLRTQLFGGRRQKSVPLVLIWLGVMLLCGWQAGHVKINGELRTLSLVPAELHAAEEEIRETWGNMRGMAMVFAEGTDLQDALRRNDDLFARLRRELPELSPVSLAPLLPSEATQRENRHLWRGFWEERLPAVRQELLSSGARRKFAANAFSPFFDSFDREPSPVTVDDLRLQGLGGLVDTLLIPGDDGVQIVTLVPDTPDVAQLFASGTLSGDRLHFVSQGNFGREVGRAIKDDFLRFITLAGLSVVTILAILFRRPKMVLLALLPVVTGMVVMLGVMGWFGIEFNLFNIVATILIIGLGVDYGIFMLCRDQDGKDGGTQRAVLVAGLTTLAGFGVLILARHPALHSIGVTVLLGIGAAIPAALLVVPVFDGKERL